MRATAVASITADLLRMYDKAGPRYTSYPTAVEFSDSFTADAYGAKLDEAATLDSEPLSLYLHLPFCEERCTFCGCAVIATRRREVVSRYLDYLLREIGMLADRLGHRRRVIQYHWGGGTPTYLTSAELTALHAGVQRHFGIDPQAEGGVEVDPRVTTREQIDTLRALGFNRLSMGVQDFTPEVQEAIGRRQSAAATRSLFYDARGAGFHSINVDLVYGLPRQRLETFSRTIESVVEMRPERVAVYSYAHVPWLRANQKKIEPRDLPSPELKLDLFGAAVDVFLDAGYRQIGMDHFARPDDELARAAERGALHRNFMGYTTRLATDMVAAGLTAIGDIRGAYAQNVKKLSSYYAALDAGRFPIERGLPLTRDDLLRRFVITQLMCNFTVDLAEVERRFGVSVEDYFARELIALASGPAAHGFVTMRPDRLQVTVRGRLFVRNICMVFDHYLRQKPVEQRMFSRTI
ncbi:MAG: oxygen-independent coproporphyrinogen III oxidase [Acidobacteria bacterium]|nr:oxygen-independent coproporphyrinogen III oxidase [Acidobacteriota bacterium]